MTVWEAFPLLSPAEQTNLQFWAEEFGIPLREFHLGHIRTYQSQRLRAASREVVNAEVSTLLSLLDTVGAGDEIRRHYQPLRVPDELSAEERASLPERVLTYLNSKASSRNYERGTTEPRIVCERQTGPSGHAETELAKGTSHGYKSEDGSDDLREGSGDVSVCRGVRGRWKGRVCQEKASPA
jgi:hypothetical protein